MSDFRRVKGLAGLAVVIALMGAPLAGGMAHAQDNTMAAAPVVQTAPQAATGTAAAATAPAAAASTPAPTPASPFVAGDTAWMLTSTALVLMMTIPGLALFYGGMVRRKNVIATVAQSFAITAVVTLVWYIATYSIAFSTDPDPNMNKYWGGLSNAMLKTVSMTKGFSVAGTAQTIPEYVYMTYQMTFAIITPALICGAFAERMKFSALLLFTVLWSIFVYAPIAHWCGAAGSWGASA